MKRRKSLLLIAATFIAASASADSYQLIVYDKVAASSVERRFIVDTFFKKVTHWPEDGLIQPVDQRPDSTIRRKFSEDILERSVMGVKNYWQQLIFSGKDVPPPEL